jgi:hypothetical protein
VPGVAGQFAQDQLLKVLALAKVIVTCLMIPLGGAAAGANLAWTRPAADVPAMRPYAFTPPLGGGAAWSRAQGLPGLSTTPPGRDSGLPGLPGGAWT